MPPLSSLLEGLYSASAESVAGVAVEAAVDAVIHKNDNASDEPTPPADTQVSTGS